MSEILFKADMTQPDGTLKPVIVCCSTSADVPNPLDLLEDKVLVRIEHAKYQLGHPDAAKKSYCILSEAFAASETYETVEDMFEDLGWWNSFRHLGYPIEPIYGYSHGSLTIACHGFSCHYDSGQLGYIVGISPEYTSEKLKEVVHDYNEYINGRYYTLELLDEDRSVPYHKIHVYGNMPTDKESLFIVTQKHMKTPVIVNARRVHAVKLEETLTKHFYIEAADSESAVNLVRENYDKGEDGYVLSYEHHTHTSITIDDI